jgi:RNA polymerase sigma-70 factor, ECF subfamily
MNTNNAIRDEMVAAIPHLRQLAVSLSGAQQADDLVQQTLLLACDTVRSFDARSEVLPWLVTILRNEFYSEHCKRRREIVHVDGAYAETPTTAPMQIAHAEHAALRASVLKLPKQMREALIAVGYSGLSYEEAAQACECPVGTIRSRVHRGRERLGALLGIESPADFAAVNPYVGW